jgi:hypothetical protein
MVSCEVERHITGDAIRGKEHLGRPTPPMREKSHSPLVLLLGRLVDTRLGHKARIGVYDSCPTTALAGVAREIRAPPFEPKESVA